MRPENAAASNCRYGRKIQASNYQIRPENSASSNYRNGREIPAKKENYCPCHLHTRLQWRSGRSPGSYSEGRRFAPPLCSITFPLHRWKIPVAPKTQQKNQAHMAKTFFALCTKWVSGTRSWVAENHVKPCNSAGMSSGYQFSIYCRHYSQQYFVKRTSSKIWFVNLML